VVLVGGVVVGGLVTVAVVVVGVVVTGVLVATVGVGWGATVLSVAWVLVGESLVHTFLETLFWTGTLEQCSLGTFLHSVLNTPWDSLLTCVQCSFGTLRHDTLGTELHFCFPCPCLEHSRT